VDTSTQAVSKKAGPRQRGFLWDLTGEKGAVLRSGRIEAVTLRAAKAKLRRMYPDFPFERFRIRQEPRQWLGSRVTEEQLVGFLRQFSTMARAGIPVLERLDALLETEIPPALRSLLLDLRKSLNEGQSLSQAFAAYPQYFSTQELAMLRVGELGGAMDEILAQIATYREKTQMLNRRNRWYLERRGSRVFYRKSFFCGNCASGSYTAQVSIPRSYHASSFCSPAADPGW